MEQTSAQFECVHANRVLFPIRDPGRGGGLGGGVEAERNVFVNEVCWNPNNSAVKSHHGCQPRAESWSAATMMIKMIPHTSPMILNILAFLEASMAADASPTLLALCAFGKAQV